jgi:hypothetical protein
MQTVKLKKLGLSLLLVSALTFGLTGLASGAEQSVDLEATIAQRLVFSIAEGGSVSLVANPVDSPTAEAASSFNVKTNVGSYSISANFGKFTVEDTDYDLIDNENFRIKSVPPDEGDAIFDWTVPSDEMTVLSGEIGYTNLQTTVVRYQLNVDFTVPSGAASTTVVFTATPSM